MISRGPFQPLLFCGSVILLGGLQGFFFFKQLLNRIQLQAQNVLSLKIIRICRLYQSRVILYLQCFEIFSFCIHSEMVLIDLL